MVNIIKDVDLIDDIQKYDVILIGTSIKNNKGNGFQHKICRNFPLIDEKNKETNYDDYNKLGTCQVINSYVNKGFPIFILCYITKGRYTPSKKPDALEYESLESCISLINENFKGKKIASTILGNSIFEGGGDRERILEIIGNNSNDIDLYLYDYVQKDYRQEDNENYFKINDLYSNGKITKDEYYERKKHFLWDKAFGKYLLPIPEELSEREVKKRIREIKETL